MRLKLAALFALSLLASCNGPKDTCQASAESFYNLWRNHNWESVYDMLTPAQQKKVKTVDKLHALEAEDWDPTHSFSVKWQNFAETKDGVCIVNGTWTYTWKVRGKEPVTTEDEYFSWTFRKAQDGLWYAELPGQEKIQGF